MPRVSDKGQQMPPSPIRKLVPFAEAARARGTRVLPLNIGQPDIRTPQVFWDRLAHPGIDVLAYGNSDGMAPYKEAWAKYYTGLGAPVLPSEVLVTTGASEALQIGKMTCMDPGDEIIVPEPMYANYIGFARAGSIRVRPVTTSIDEGFALPPIESFEALIGPRTKAVLICNPNNPTGYLYTREELETLRAIVLRHDLFLFADEVYREFAYEGRRHTSVLALEGLDQHAVVFDSISKRFSACGARIGALITRNHEVLDAALKFAQARLCPPSLGQIAGQALFDLPPSYHEEVLAEYDARRRFLVDGLRSIHGVRCPMPGGAFYVMAELPVDDTDRFCRWLLEEFEDRGVTVMLAPGAGFYSTPDLGRRQVRAAYVLRRDDLDLAVVALRKALAAYPGRREVTAGTRAPARKG